MSTIDNIEALAAYAARAFSCAECNAARGPMKLLLPLLRNRLVAEVRGSAIRAEIYPT